MKVGITVRGDLRELMQRDLRAAEGAVTRAVAAASLETQGAVRTDTRAALGPRIANAWRRVGFPQGQASLGAAGLVFSKAPNIVDAFSSGQTIVPRRGESLAIPMAYARQIRGPANEKVTPRIFTQRTGIKLRAIKRGKRAVLVGDVPIADGAIALRKSAASGKVLKSGRVRARSRRGATRTVVLFVLIRSVALGKRLNLEAQAQSAVVRLSRYINAAMDEAFR